MDPWQWCALPLTRRIHTRVRRRGSSARWPPLWGTVSNSHIGGALVLDTLGRSVIALLLRPNWRWPRVSPARPRAMERGGSRGRRGDDNFVGVAGSLPPGQRHLLLRGHHATLTIATWRASSSWAHTLATAAFLHLRTLRLQVRRVSSGSRPPHGSAAGKSALRKSLKFSSAAARP